MHLTDYDLIRPCTAWNKFVGIVDTDSPYVSIVLLKSNTSTVSPSEKEIKAFSFPCFFG